MPDDSMHQLPEVNVAYRVSDRLVEKHHRQVFDGVLSRQLGPTRLVLPLDATEKQQVQRLVTKHRQAGHLKKGGDDIAQKIEERSRTAPPAVKVLLWIFAPPPASEPWWKVRDMSTVNDGLGTVSGSTIMPESCVHSFSSMKPGIDDCPTCAQRLPRRLVNAPARLIFPAGSKLLQAGNSRSYAMNALKPYLKRVSIFSSWPERCFADTQTGAILPSHVAQHGAMSCGLLCFALWAVQKGLTSWEEQAAVAYENRWSFRAFGAVAYGLGFVPILSWILNFTTSIGAALWAADMERGNKLQFA